MTGSSPTYTRRRWLFVWTPQTAPFTAGTDRYYVGINSNAGSASAVTYEYGVVTAEGNVPIMQGSADAGSVDTATGIIRIAIANANIERSNCAVSFCGNGFYRRRRHSAGSVADKRVSAVGGRVDRGRFTDAAIAIQAESSSAQYRELRTRTGVAHLTIAEVLNAAGCC